MSQIVNVLIIEDQPIIIGVYKEAFNQVSADLKKSTFKISTAKTCDEAIICIENAVKTKALDLVFLDISLPKSINGKFLSGEDLGLRINKLFENVKIVVLTSFSDNHRLTNILNNLKPIGLMVKNDFEFKDLKDAIASALSNTPYYSRTVLDLIWGRVSADFDIDHIDRQLLHELSIGTKMKDLPEIIPLSKGGIERRKRLLKNAFKVEIRDDKMLIQVAKEKGFI